jgi:two-component system LytT family sensor kinase
MRIRRLLPIFAWLLVGLVFTSQLHLFAARTGGKMGWLDAFTWEVPRWLLWVLLAPIVTTIARKYPLRRQNAARRIIFHTLCACVLSFVHLILFVLIFHLIRLSMSNQGNLMATFLFAFPLDFHVGVAVYWLLILLKENSDARQRVARLQAELTQAQLQALKMQLHPHFLFNTLNSISSFLRTDVETADEMIGRLGEFLRLTLQNPGTEEIALSKELEFLKRYLEIEQMRFQDRLESQFEIDPDTLGALVPNLILQPVVENAVRHGISAGSGSGSIRVTAKRQNGELLITVYDNGPGLPSEISEGIGLGATRDRLQRMYGIEGRLELTNHPEGGAIVTVAIPFHTAEKIQ